MLSRQYFYGLLFCFVFYGCAHQVAPTGGNKDTSPPKLEHAFPKNLQTHFAAKKIRFVFDEFVVLNNASEQIVISPALSQKPEIYADKRWIVVDLKHNNLLPNTTYTINFGNAIGDFHENNVLADLTYVFSTGAFIDSCFFSGVVKNAFTNEPEKNITVGVYPSSGFSDSVVYKNKPTYFSKTSASGSFKINNLPADNYRLFAFSDDNKNLLYDATEKCAFDTIVHHSSDSSFRSGLVFFLYKPNSYHINRIVDTFCTERDRFVFLVYKPSEFSVSPVYQKQYYRYTKPAPDDMDSIIVIVPSCPDSMFFKISTPDTSYEVLLNNSRKKQKSRGFGISLSEVKKTADDLLISCTNPFVYVDTSRISIYKDSIRISYTLRYTDSTHRHASIHSDWKENARYRFLIKDSAVKDVWGRFSNAVEGSGTIMANKDMGNLTLIVLSDSGSVPYLFQLLGSDEKQILYQCHITNDTTLSFNNINPGTYKVKLIADRNKNQKWDNGDLHFFLLPEQVYYYPDALNVKAFWDIEQTISIKPLLKY